jgi:hypothetical protein
MKTKQFGYVRKDDVEDRHLQKQKAGLFFATNPDVESVWVGNEQGKTALYLKKDPVTGECIMREENDI